MRKIFRWLKNRNALARNGMVAKFDKDMISGSIFAHAVSPGSQTVQLYINDMLGLKSVLCPGPKGNADFQSGMYDVWRFAQRSDSISVRYKGEALLMPNRAFSMHPTRDGKEDLGQLRKRFEAGQSFDETGRITKQSKDLEHTWQVGVLKLSEEVDQIIVQVTGADSFMFSGKLLGYIRNNGLIPHDKDMDCAFLSSKPTAVEIANEFARLAHALIHEGYSVTPKATCISVRRTPRSNIMVDIAHVFLKPDGTVGFPFGRVALSH